MKTNSFAIITLVTGTIFFSCSVFDQNSTICEKHLENLPAQLNPDNSITQNYLMTTDYVDYDLFGNFQRKKRISGECSFLKDGFVRWNNIKIAHSQIQSEEYPEGEKQNIMENFTYHPSSDILNDTFFNSIPQADVYMKNLVWDLAGIETFAWYKWDSLKLNQDLSAKEINFEIDLPELGTFENKDIRITWIGITNINNEICAIINYKAMNNPLYMSSSNFYIRGRSHYWGNIYVSLSDKHIEYADLNEDVIMDIRVTGQDNSNYANTVRKITLEKIH